MTERLMSPAIPGLERLSKGLPQAQREAEIQRLECQVDGLVQAWLRGPLTGNAAARAYDRNIRPLIRQIRKLYLQEKRRKP